MLLYCPAQSADMVKYYETQVFILPAKYWPVLQPSLAWAAPFPLITPNLLVCTTKSLVLGLSHVVFFLWEWCLGLLHIVTSYSSFKTSLQSHFSRKLARIFAFPFHKFFFQMIFLCASLASLRTLLKDHAYNFVRPAQRKLQLKVMIHIIVVIIVVL